MFYVPTVVKKGFLTFDPIQHYTIYYHEVSAILICMPLPAGTAFL
jgi:hypothetical protein